MSKEILKSGTFFKTMIYNKESIQNFENKSNGRLNFTCLFDQKTLCFHNVKSRQQLLYGKQ